MKKDKNKTNQILEALLMVVIATVLMLAATYYFPLLICLFPIPFIILGVKYGMKYNIISFLISILIIGVVLDPESALFVALIFLPLSIGLNYMIKMRKKSMEILAINTLIIFLSIIIVIYVAASVTGVNITEQLEDPFSQVLEEQMKLIEDKDYSSYEISQIKDVLETGLDYILSLLPTIVMIFSLIITTVSYIISLWVLKRMNSDINYIPKFSRFKLPDNIIIGVAIMLLGAFLIEKLNIISYGALILNIAVFSSFMFSVQGLSVIDHKLIETDMKLVPRILIIGFFIILLPLGWIISLFGILDVMFDFRKIGKRA